MKFLKRKAVVGGMIGAIALSCIIPTFSLFANKENTEKSRGESYADKTGLFLSLDEEGEVSYVAVDRDSYDVDPEGMNFGDEKQMTKNSGGAISPTSVVNFNYKIASDKGGYKTYYANANKTGTNGYVAGTYAADAAYLGVNDAGTMVKFKMAGVVGWVSSSAVDIVPLSSAKSKSRYRVSEGRIYHDITLNIYQSGYASSVLVGYQQNYMKDGDVYYSYDGHYFYKDYATMLSDYRNGNYTNAINAKNPYYNYYQYLSHRSDAKFTADDYNKRVKNVIGNATSKMQNLGSAFVKAQDETSINAALVFGLACNESGWGQSSIALNKNNIFGHGAVDSDPYNQANSYASPTQSILSHAKAWVADGYIYPGDWRYHGPHLGDKESGMNVEYASDPYWGEKAAAQGYYLEMQTNKKDSTTYQIGILNQSIDLNIRKEANTSSTVLYGTGTGTLNSATPVNNFPFIILGEVKGESVNGNTTWYKVASDASLTKDRTSLAPMKSGTIALDYDTSKDYVYVSAYYVDKANSVKAETPTPSYKKGDVNGDGTITPADYVKVKNHIMGKSKLTGAGLEAADMNGDGNVTPADYVKIKNKIMGK